MIRVIDALEDSGGVQNVYANGDIDEKVLEELGVDPGLTRCGIGVVKVAVIRTPAAMLTPRRLLALQTEMDA